MKNWREEAHKSGRLKHVNLLDESKTFERKVKRRKKHKRSCKALECIICTLRFSSEDVHNGVYNIQTFVCSYCYAEMQQKPHYQSCFGKPTFILLNGKRELGYDPNARECRDSCPDRVLCQRIVRPDLSNH